MKIQPLFWSLLIGMHSCKAQDKFVAPPIEKVELVTNLGIQYKFPSNIEISLNQAISKQEKDTHIIRLQTINDSTFTLILYCLNNSKGDNSSPYLITKKTGRYYESKNKQVPIIFDTDYKFSTPGFVITHSCYWITFKNTTKEGIIIQKE